MNLFIDDERYPPNDGTNWTIVRSSSEAIEYVLNHGCPTFISFDHDLGGEDTAMVFLHWLIEKDMDQPGFIPAELTFAVHSQNPIGARNLKCLLEGYLLSKSM